MSNTLYLPKLDFHRLWTLAVVASEKAAVEAVRGDRRAVLIHLGGVTVRLAAAEQP